MEPASQGLIEPGVPAIFRAERLEATSPVIAMEYARSVIEVVGKSAYFSAEIGKFERRLKAGTLISPNTLYDNIRRQSYTDFLKIGGSQSRNLS